ETKRAYESDAIFVRAVESSVSPGAMVLQLPYMRFPESGGWPGRPPSDYEPLKLFLHSRSVHWSYPAMYGREADAWAREISERPVDEMAPLVADAGFEGIVVQRAGYADRGAAIEAALTRELGTTPTVSPNGGFAFFGVGGYQQRRLAGVSPEDRA